MLPEICYICGNTIKMVERKRILKNTTKVKSTRCCKECKEKAKQKRLNMVRSEHLRSYNSERMKQNNPMKHAEARAKAVSSRLGEYRDPKDYILLRKDIPKETPEETSQRMRENNPIHKPGVFEKRQSTYKARRTAKEITYKRGPEHHLWRGNIDFNNSCRRDLYNQWTFPVMERDNFKCTLCGSKKDIQVHHIKPLREFINEVRVKYNIGLFTDYSAEELYPLVQEVVTNHQLSDGVTVCKKCHYVIDERYHVRPPDEN